jgi:2,2-dialkylglycine decarboxylase (pyruvate)
MRGGEDGLVQRCVVRGGLGIVRMAPPIPIEACEIDLGLEIFNRALARAVH